MNIFKEIMGYLGQIGWPLAVVILAIIFRKQLARLLDRTEKLGPEGLQASIKGQEQLSDVSSRVQEIQKAYLNPLLVEQVDILKAEMKKLNVSSHDEREDILFKALASNQIGLTFEKTYALIYGSQLALLHFLNASFGGMANIEQLKPFYEKAKSSFPDLYANYSFEAWLNYLESSVLILKTDGKLGITVRGKEFLKYLIDQNKPLNKYG